MSLDGIEPPFWVTNINILTYSFTISLKFIFHKDEPFWVTIIQHSRIFVHNFTQIHISQGQRHSPLIYFIA